MPDEGQKMPQGKFSIEISKTDSRRDLPTVNIGEERQRSFQDGAATAVCVFFGIAALIFIIAIAVASHK